MLKCQQLLAFLHLWAGKFYALQLSWVEHEKSFITSGPVHFKALKLTHVTVLEARDRSILYKQGDLMLKN